MAADQLATDANFYRHADLLAAYIDASELLPNISAQVARYQDLESEAAIAVQKATEGGLVVIGLTGWSNLNEDGGAAMFRLQHGISFWATPTALEGMVMDDYWRILMQIVATVQGFAPAVADGSGMYSSRRWSTRRGSYVPNDNYTVYEFAGFVDYDPRLELSVPVG